MNSIWLQRRFEHVRPSITSKRRFPVQNDGQHLLYYFYGKR